MTILEPINIRAGQTLCVNIEGVNLIIHVSENRRRFITGPIFHANLTVSELSPTYGFMESDERRRNAALGR